MNIVFAIFLILAGILVFLKSSLSILGLLIIITIGLAIQGIYRVSYGIFNKNISLWATMLNLIFGGISIGVSIYIVINSVIATQSIIILLCLVFGLNGIIRILSGFRGYVNIEDE